MLRRNGDNLSFVCILLTRDASYQFHVDKWWIWNEIDDMYKSSLGRSGKKNESEWNERIIQ